MHVPHFNCFSCRNLLLLRKRKPIMYLTIQEDHKVTIYHHFFNFGPVGPNVEISSGLSPKGLNFTKISPTLWHSQNDLLEHKKVNKTEIMLTFSMLSQPAWTRKLSSSWQRKGNVNFAHIRFFQFWANKVCKI